MSVTEKRLNILGIRGLPAAHGGFETFAHHFSLWLKDQGWEVFVYCQHDSNDETAPPDGTIDEWQGIHLINLTSSGSGPASTIKFDLKATRHVLRQPGIDLVLGYNTAVFAILQRLKGRKVIMNMDGIEWKRDKWGPAAKAWFYVNELVGSHVCTLPVADHPEIAKHLERHGTKGVRVIPYGSAAITDAPATQLEPYGLEPGRYMISIARIEPENSILEIVETFSEEPRETKLVVLGNFRDDNEYHRRVRQAASPDVVFPGAIYDTETVSALRYHCRAYLHGHQVGGTNPSLVEALGAGNAIIAHDNRFNRWVTRDGQFYFSTKQQLKKIIADMIASDQLVTEAQARARIAHSESFTFETIHRSYLAALESVF
ncbi:MAG: glycosyl transferase [Rhizobiaceae bacterium]|nr:glycosyl transferase [Rhizobiaceae bacterium]